MVARALKSLADRQSSWRPAEALRKIAAATPTNTSISSAEPTQPLDTMTGPAVKDVCVDISRPIPNGMERRRDGRPVTEPAVDRALTIQPILNGEGAVLRGLTRVGRDNLIRLGGG